MVAAPARSAWAGGGHRGLNGEGTMARGQVQAGGTQDKALGRCVAKAAAGAAAPPALPGEGEAKPEHNGEAGARQPGGGSGGGEERGGAGVRGGPGRAGPSRAELPRSGPRGQASAAAIMGWQAASIMGWRALLWGGRASRDYYGMVRPPATGGGQVGGRAYYGMAGARAAGGSIMG